MIKKEKRNYIFFLKLIFYPSNLVFNKILKVLGIYLIWRSGTAIGDQVLMAGFAKKLNFRMKNKIFVITNYPKLLELSPWISKSTSPSLIPFWNIIYYILKLFEGERLIEYNFPYKSYGFKSHLDAYNNGFYEYVNKPAIWHAHVVDRFEKDFFKNFIGGLQSPNIQEVSYIISEIRNNFSSEKKIGIINPTGKSSYTKAKMYGFENYQLIVNNTLKKIKWLQVGKQDDRLLQNIYSDLRGKDLVFLVNIIALSDLVLADEGLLNHISGSFPKVNSYVTYSEFSPLNYYSYKNTKTIGKPQSEKIFNYWKLDASRKNKKINPKKLAKEIIDNEFNF